MKFISKMNITTTGLKLLAVAGIATATLLDAAPSKAILYIDFIPLSATQTRIQASGTLNPSHLGTSSAPAAIQTDSTGSITSGITRSVQDQLRFTHSLSTGSTPARFFAITGPNNPFTPPGAFQAWAGTTPTNTPPFILQLGTTIPTKGIRLPNTLTGCTPSGCPSPNNTASPFSGFFDVNLTLAQIFGTGGASIFTYNSGSEQIILRKDPPQVPGPLPLLGAAAAFGYSRKLRNRIQKSTPMRTA
jgi:hypothetical protein